MITAQIIALSKARSILYRFLGSVYLMEIDETMLKALKKIRFPEVEGDEDADMDLREGYALMQQVISRTEVPDLDDLAADYAKVFLAAGDAAGLAAFPYESVYVDKKHQVGGSTAMKMKALYLERGYEPDPAMYRTMDDTLGLMLEYMGILCEELTQALEKGDEKKAEQLFAEQEQFVPKHLTNWIFSFTSDVMKFAGTDFYKAIAKITNGFMKKETALLKGGRLWDTV
ncbi:MAG: molecular chaperone TorD family protein [Parasporobacterium sp.]|nr:molecular chaperone TorD family protein [Parasporobacterium sp.]